MNYNQGPISPIDRRTLLISANWIIIGACILLAVIAFSSSGFSGFPAAFILIQVGCAGNLIYLRSGGSLNTAGSIFIGLLLVALGLGGFNTYGFHGSLVLMSPMIPIFALLLLNARSAVTSLVLTLLILLCLLILETIGLTPENPHNGEAVAFGRFLILSILCLITTWGLWRFTNYSRQLLERIEAQSTTDYLTGVLNRRGFEAVLAREHNGAIRNNTPLSLIIIDVDFFKQYNDNNGHQAGDTCLVAIAEVIKSCVTRKTDVVGRFGGEEFVIILPNTRSEGACILAEKIRAGIVARALPYKSGEANFVTVTAGVASRRGRTMGSVDDLFKEADNALYRGKETGRNRVVCTSIEDS